jgi:hypothetical protein
VITHNHQQNHPLTSDDLRVAWALPYSKSLPPQAVCHRAVSDSYEASALQPRRSRPVPWHSQKGEAGNPETPEKNGKVYNYISADPGRRKGERARE